MTIWRRVFVERRAIVLPLGIALLANIGVLALAVVPLRTNVTTEQGRASDAALNLKIANASLKHAQDARDSRDRADRELKKFYADVLPVSQGGALRVTTEELSQLASESGLTVQDETRTDTPMRDSHLSRMVVKATLVGEYANIRHFLYAVETSPAFLSVDDLALEPAATTQQAATNGSLRIVLDVSTYYLAGAR